MNNKYSWNETLKFSWGHIIAFLAIIFLSYVCYMGNFYQNGGDFKAAAIKVLFIDLILLSTFIGAQIAKGTDSKFERNIIIERILICLCPLVFLVAMLSYNHFWNVFRERKQIETKFTTSIEKSKQMFIDYDNYSSERIERYKITLNKIIQRKDIDTKTYYDCGFNGNSDEIRKNNLIMTMHLQLQSQNTDSLKLLANQWINNANQGASVWNAFLVGNVDKISDAIKTWNKTLVDYSSPVLTGETTYGQTVNSFASDNDAITNANNGLKSLTQIYQNSTGIKVTSLLTSMLLFLMLLFPYFLQRRSTRANGLYYLLPNNKRKNIKNKSFNDEKETPESEETIYTNSDDIYGGTF